MNLEEIKARINPQYADTIGTESYERKWLCDEIESLHQQVNNQAVDITLLRRQVSALEKQNGELESLRQKLADSQKQIAMLREPAKYLCRDMKGTQAESDFALPMFLLEEALSATADLDNYVLCEKEPVAYTPAGFCDDGEPLYRAKERK